MFCEVLMGDPCFFGSFEFRFRGFEPFRVAGMLGIGVVGYGFRASLEV